MKGKMIAVGMLFVCLLAGIWSGCADDGEKRIAYDGCEISDAKNLSKINNGDGIINAGETILLKVSVKNRSEPGNNETDYDVYLHDVRVELSTTSSYVRFDQSSAQYGGLSKGASAQKEFKFTVDKSCPTTDIPITVKITYSEGSDSGNFTLKVIGIASIDERYWGTWIQMDTGDEYYIDGQYVYEVSGSNKTYRQSGISGYVLESSEVLKNGSTVFFRKGGGKRSFKASFSGFDSSAFARAAGTGSQAISGRRQNVSNAADSEPFTAVTDGDEITFAGGVADDSQQITVDGSDTDVIVDPQYDGEHIGTIPVVETGKYAFKTTYTVSNRNDQGFMYGNMLGEYKATFYFTNVGSATCETSMYTISWNDNNLRSDDLVCTGNFSSIEPGNSKSVTGTFYYYGNFSEEYKDVTINITIQDSGYGQTWHDSVVMRFYRGWVDMKVTARNFETGNSSNSKNVELKGFLIYPDGRSKRFVVPAGSTNTVSVPWSTSDYYIVLSGATTATEVGYSFGASVADLSGTWSINEINAYEPNDSIATASVVSLDNPVKAYLKPNDLDYYKVNVSSLSCSKGGIAYAGHKIGDGTSLGTLNNGDESINPGETIAMDVMVENTSKIDLKYVGVTVSSTSQYVTFESSSAEYGNITAGYYQTYCYKKYRDGNGGFSSNTSSSAYYNFNSYAPFKFTVDKNCPVGTNLPITVTMTDASGLEWTDTFNLTVK